MLILAGVSINLVLGPNGLITKAQEAALKTDESQEKEGIEMAISSSKMEDVNTLEISKTNLEKALREQFGNNKDFTVIDNGDGSFLINMNDTQRSYYIESTGDIIDESNMIKIGTAEELKAFRDDVNSGNTYEGKYIKLTNNITLDSDEEWEPIGIYQEDSTSPDDEGNIAFSGIFDGDFYTISGISTNSNLKTRGLFGLINEATIKNVGIVNGNIQGTARCGAIVGYAYKNNKIINCYNSSSINATDNFMGGIAGFIYEGTIIENCYNTGNITSSGINIGGIVGGMKNAIIINCYNVGELEGVYVGGICSVVYNNASIENCYNIGDLKGSTRALSINVINSNLVAFKNNYYLENSVNGSNDIYVQEECKVKNREEMLNLYTVLGESYKEDINNINNGYPILTWQ